MPSLAIPLLCRTMNTSRAQPSPRQRAAMSMDSLICTMRWMGPTICMCWSLRSTKWPFIRNTGPTTSCLYSQASSTALELVGDFDIYDQVCFLWMKTQENVLQKESTERLLCLWNEKQQLWCVCVCALAVLVNVHVCRGQTTTLVSFPQRSRPWFLKLGLLLLRAQWFDKVGWVCEPQISVGLCLPSSGIIHTDHYTQLYKIHGSWDSTTGLCACKTSSLPTEISPTPC